MTIVLATDRDFRAVNEHLFVNLQTETLHLELYYKDVVMVQSWGK